MALRSARLDDSLSASVPAQRTTPHFGDVESSAPTIHVEDLVPDALGEIVLYNDSSLRALSLVSTVPVLSHGEAPTHVTLSGDDVTGFRQLKLISGLTIFYPRELIVSVTLHTSA